MTKEEVESIAEALYPKYKEQMGYNTVYRTPVNERAAYVNGYMKAHKEKTRGWVDLQEVIKTILILKEHSMPIKIGDSEDIYHEGQCKMADKIIKTLMAL